MRPPRGQVVREGKGAVGHSNVKKLGGCRFIKGNPEGMGRKVGWKPGSVLS